MLLANATVRLVERLGLVADRAGVHLVPYYQDDLKIDGQNWRGLFGEICEELDADDILVTTYKSTAPAKYYADCYTRKMYNFYEDELPPLEGKAIFVIGMLDQDEEAFGYIVAHPDQINKTKLFC